MEQRQIDLELALAKAHGVPVRRMALQAETPVAIWDFRRAMELIEHGYELARREIAQWEPGRRPGWREWLVRFHG